MIKRIQTSGRLLLPGLLFAALTWGLALVGSPAETALQNSFFAFDNGVGRGKWTTQQQAKTLKELGYAGIGYTGMDNLPEQLKVFGAHGLTVFSIYMHCNPSKEDACSPQLEKAIEQLKGSRTRLWLTVQGKSNDDKAARVVRSIADVASNHGVEVVLYPHFGLYVATARDALRLLKKVDRDNVGLAINLCHELRAGNAAQLGDIIKEAGSQLRLVSINGADREGGWDKLIKTLDQGEFDMLTFLKSLRDANYEGPIGLQCYNVKGDQRENLEKSMTAWKQLRRSAAGH